MTHAAPAGWHPDPHGQPVQRFWDGAQWTDHTQPFPDVYQQQMLALAQHRESRSGTTGGAVLVILLVIFVLTVIGIALSRAN